MKYKKLKQATSKEDNRNDKRNARKANKRCITKTKKLIETRSINRKTR